MTSPIRAFVAERCVIRPPAKVAIITIFKDWQDWCRTIGYSHTGNIQSFGKHIRAAFPGITITRPQEDVSRQRYYEGISLVSDHSSSADVREQT